MKQIFVLLVLLIWCLVTMILTITVIGLIPLLCMLDEGWVDIPKDCIKKLLQ